MKKKFFPIKGTAGKIMEAILKTDDPEVSYHILRKVELALLQKATDENIDLKKEFRNYIYYGGFAFGLNQSSMVIFNKIVDMVDRVVYFDLPTISEVKTGSLEHIKKILAFLCLQKPGGVSQTRISDHLNISVSHVHSLLNALEKTQLIFKVPPYGSAGKIARKPWKYYFMSPSICTALLSRLKRIDQTETFGILSEDLVASYLFRLNKTTAIPSGLYYEHGKRGVDFLLESPYYEKLIPLEVGSVDNSQVKSSMKRHGSNMGFIISNKVPKVSIKDNIIHIPIETFAFA